jgi:hypothetical protein
MPLEEMIALLQSNRIEPHGVINLRAVLNVLDEQQRDPVGEFTTLFFESPPHALTWRFYAVEGMRALAARWRLGDGGAHTLLLDMTPEIVLQMGTDEYYKSITAVATLPEPSPVLLTFAQWELNVQDVQDWRWVAFFAVASYLEKSPRGFPMDLARRLREQATWEAVSEIDRQRRPQLEEIAEAAIATAEERGEGRGMTFSAG